MDDPAVAKANCKDQQRDKWMVESGKADGLTKKRVNLVAKKAADAATKLAKEHDKGQKNALNIRKLALANLPWSLPLPLLPVLTRCNCLRISFPCLAGHARLLGVTGEGEERRTGGEIDSEGESSGDESERAAVFPGLDVGLAMLELSIDVGD